MPAFNVILTRDTTESVMVVIEAADEHEAMDGAMLTAQQHPDRLRWEPDDTPNASADVYVTHVEAVDEEGFAAVAPESQRRFSFRCLFGFHDFVSHDMGCTARCTRCSWNSVNCN